MSWDEIKLAVNCLVIGAAVGALGLPVWKLLKKIYHELKVAKNEWRK